jgi:chorismate mutase/prephenate dehydratase
MELDDWRMEIDKIDAEIVRLLNQRAKLCRKIGNWKREIGLPIVDLERERMILRNALLNNEGAVSDLGITRIFREIIRESRSLQVEAQTENTLSRCSESAPVYAEETSGLRVLACE